MTIYIPLTCYCYSTTHREWRTWWCRWKFS